NARLGLGHELAEPGLGLGDGPLGRGCGLGVNRALHVGHDSHNPAAAQAAATQGRPMRLISQSSWTPVFASTSARTASPSPSISAAVASPGLIMKLLWSSLNIAPPPVARN